jgi:trimethylamine:corrinoid methyltransferase-like protein
MTREAAEPRLPPDARDASRRVHDVWIRIIADRISPPVDPARVEELDAIFDARTKAGGAPPVS